MLSMTFAQNMTITGTVKDGLSGELLPGVSIVEKGTSNGTITDVGGNYTLKLTMHDAILVFSFIGYAAQEEAINGRSNIDISLLTATSVLNEVVITALGLERKTKDLGYAVQSLSAKEVSEVKSANFVDNLAGRVAGVTVSQGATGVGSTSKITIRGEASFTNNNPLFVVDGTPINNNSIVNFTNDAAAGFQEVDFGNGGMEVNPDDIASVTVLKGPSAAALYGTRASNGVIIITTKDGSEHQGLGISFNSTTFVERPFQLPEFQHKFGQGNSGQFEFVDGLGGGTNDNITYSWGPALDQGILIPQFDSPVALPDGRVVRGGDIAVHGGLPITPTAFNSHPDNLKDFYKTGISTFNNLSISSGFDKGHFRLSLTDLWSESIIPGVNLDRKTVAARFTFQPIAQLRITSAVNYVNSQSDNRPANGYGSENVNYSLVAWGPRSLNIDHLKDYWQPGLTDVQQYSFNYTFFDNPYFILLENRNAFNRDRVFGNIAASYDFTDHLSLTLRSGMDYSNELREFRRAFSSNRFINGAYAEHSVFFRENNTDLLLNYNQSFGDFAIDFSVGGNRMDREAATVQTQATSLAQPGVFNLSNAASPLEIFEYETKKRINSLYGIAKLGYKGFLYLDITGRNDWSSALATPISTDNASFFYPSVSGSFIVSNVVDLPEGFSFAKLRASWAQVGNDTDPYQTTGAFIAQTPYNAQPTFSDQSTVANAGLLPEKTTSFELGGDVRFFDDRLRFDVTYYNALTENQIISLPIAISSGYTEQVVNGGGVRSKGVEILAGITPIKTPNFQWDVMLNFSRNIATVESLPDGVDRLTLAYSRVYDNVNQTVWFQVEEGGRIGDMYGTGYLKNENGDFVIDENGNYVVDNNLILLGNYNPDFMLGISNYFRYKNWSMSFLIDWRQGGVLVSRTLALAAVGGQLIETENRPETGIVAEGVVNTGTAETPKWEANTTAVTAEQYYRQYYDRNHEENNTYEGTYVKLREFSIGYTLKSDSNTGFLSNGRTLNISLIGRNLFALSDIPHFDPEQLAVQGQKFVSGVEDMSYATTRSLGVKLGFNF
ncbi:MAG: SusC/RagA family TonB-linked outer membrane protein [Saprospiraceae bacterium]|nr:MAG: SusC/RagA family TonB-linked outer membrane protein [Saprospiraceae bacterium]